MLTLGALAQTGRFLARHPLTREHKCRALARYVSWQVRSRLHDELIIPWIEGTRLAVRRGMIGATGNIYAGLHEFPDMAFLLHFLRAGDLFVYVGANVGSYTVLASGVCRARTAAFEPDPDAAAALRRNVRINRLEDLVIVHETAVGSERHGARPVSRGGSMRPITSPPRRKRADAPGPGGYARSWSRRPGTDHDQARHRGL